MKKQSRRRFFIILNAGIFTLLLFLWNKFTLQYIQSAKQKERIIPLEKNKQVSFHKDFIVVQHERTLEVFSSKCTHLGCKIQELKQGKLICPCHGSEYNLQGVPVKGPAFKPLAKFEVKLLKEQNAIEVIV